MQQIIIKEPLTKLDNNKKKKHTFSSKHLLFICILSDLHSFKKINASSKTERRFFKNRIHELQRFICLTVQCSEQYYPINLPFMRVAQISADLLLSEIERVLQSYEEFVVDQSLEIEVVQVNLPSGKDIKRNFTLIFKSH